MLDNILMFFYLIWQYAPVFMMSLLVACGFALGFLLMLCLHESEEKRNEKMVYKALRDFERILRMSPIKYIQIISKPEVKFIEPITPAQEIIPPAEVVNNMANIAKNLGFPGVDPKTRYDFVAQKKRKPAKRKTKHDC